MASKHDPTAMLHHPQVTGWLWSHWIRRLLPDAALGCRLKMGRLLTICLSHSACLSGLVPGRLSGRHRRQRLRRKLDPGGTGAGRNDAELAAGRGLQQQQAAQRLEDTVNR